MARTYGLHLIRRSLGALAATLALVLVVFLAERLTTLVEMLIKRNAPLTDLPLVLGLTAPEILITAMPLALLIGIYRALLESRDGGETVALAGAGVGPWGLMSALLGLGAVSFGLVVFVAGWVDPLARATREKLFLDAARAVVLDAVGNGLAHDRVESLNGYTFVSPSGGAGRERRLLVFAPRSGRVEQIVAASDYELIELESERRYHLRLWDVTVSELALDVPTGDKGDKTRAGGSGYRLGTVARDVDLDRALREPVLGDQPEFGDLATLIRTAATDSAKKGHGLRAAEILTRAWLSIAAVLLAAIAVSFADGRRRFFVLPIAGAAMIVFDLALVRMVRSFGATTTAGGLTQGAAAVAILIAGLAAALIWRYPGVVAPRGGRA
ncbi:MAG: LptF/LptG family permease [Siculibacillus sp.]|nr:LptF/LptG family permease [Siculibacillus sp.]